jgi:hypothetical protein
LLYTPSSRRDTDGILILKELPMYRSIAPGTVLVLLSLVGCGSDTETSGGTGGGAATGGTGGDDASGGAPAGSGGSTAGTGGAASGSGGDATGSGGTSGTGGGATGTGGGAPIHCDYSGCGACKEANCNVVDNPCNDEPSGECEPAQQYWRMCVCAAAGDAAASAACDTEFLAVDATNAQPIIDCVRNMCTECTVLGEETSPPPVDCEAAHPDCILCSQVTCHEQNVACFADTSCEGGIVAVGSCVCQAQMGTGTVEACVSAFETAGGTLAEDVLACVSTECPGCGF